MNRKLRIATLNIAKISAINKIVNLIGYCEEKRFDVVALQEIRFNNIGGMTDCFDFFANLGEGNGGTALLVRKNVTTKRIKKEPGGRIIKAELNGLEIINIYAPAGEHQIAARNEFFDSIIPKYLPTANKKYIILGDFNAVENKKDRRTRRGRRNLVNRALKGLIDAAEVVDVWTELRKEEEGHTFNYKGGSSRLDRIYASKEARTQIEEIKKEPVSFSDHQAVYMDIKMEGGNERKAGEKGSSWSLNTLILEEEEYRNRIINFMDHAKKDSYYATNPAEWWESKAKPGFQKISKDYSKQRAKIKRETTKFYQMCMEEAAQETEEEAWSDMRQYQREAMRWEEEKTRGRVERARPMWKPKEEELTVYHITRERRRGKASKIEKLKKENGEEAREKEEIQNEIEKYYRGMFENEEEGEKWQDRVKAGGSEEELLEGVRGAANAKNKGLTEEITAAEIFEELKKKKKGKASGSDGLPYEFYTALWKEVGGEMAKMMNDVLGRGRITESQGQAIVRLIPKKENAETIKDYRPVSLLCTDYKLLASVITRRLSNTFGTAIGEQQRGGVKGRRIESTLSLFRDLIQDTHERQGRGAIIGVDLEKAYDRVEREWVWRVMKAMGYPEEFTNWARTLYSAVKIKVNFGGGATGNIEGRRGLRQGCPLSMPLFIIYLEPMLRQLKRRMRGLAVPGGRVSARAYVDDVTIFAESEEDIAVAGDILLGYCNITGARLNKNKTQILGLGTWVEKRDWGVEWAQNTERMKLLGIEFEASIGKTIEGNWEKTKGNLLGVLRENIARNLTMHQRVRLIKESAISVCIYVAKTLPCPEKVAKVIFSHLKKFVWFRKREKTKEEVSQAKEEEGGLSLIQPEKFFRAIFLKANFETLRNEEGAAGRILEFWTAFPLRKTFKMYRRDGGPYAAGEYPSYLRKMVEDALKLIENGIITEATKTVKNREIYGMLMEGAEGKGKLEEKKKHINWKHVWRQMKILPAKLKELAFMINHDILPTQERRKKLCNTTSEICQICKQETETTLHLFFTCPGKTQLRKRIRKMAEELKLGREEEKVMHLDFPDTNEGRHAGRMAAEYMDYIWTCKIYGKTPRIEELHKRDNWKKTGTR